MRTQVFGPPFPRTICLTYLILLGTTSILLSQAKPIPSPDQATAHLSTPNTDVGLERILGLGMVVPYPYYQKPRYRYPVYDERGRGFPSKYGYGGKEMFRYTTFDKREGHH